MPASIGVNLRVTGHCRQGGRRYMEDNFSVAYQQTEDEKDLEYAFFGIYDGHGGSEASIYAKEHLMESIVRQRLFWSDKDEDVLRAIRDGFVSTHCAMWREQDKWPRTTSGLPSTAGTTASIAFIRRGKIYTGHVGDSGIVLGYQEPGVVAWQARPLTKDHKPENEAEMRRIQRCGGKVVTKCGVPRVVWNRPRIGHRGPVRRSTPIDEIPFLAVARSLGDLWSYNSALDEFIVSPEPDVAVVPIDTTTFRCLVFGTDGLWNMVSMVTAVSIVQEAEQHNEKAVLGGGEQSSHSGWINPSKSLVESALERWSSTNLRADNTSVVTLMLDPPGPPRAQVLKSRVPTSVLTTISPATPMPPPTVSTSEGPNSHCIRTSSVVTAPPTGAATTTNDRPTSPDIISGADQEEYPANGLQIVTRYDGMRNSTKMSADTRLQHLASGSGSSATAAALMPCRKYTEEFLDMICKEMYERVEVLETNSSSNGKVDRPGLQNSEIKRKYYEAPYKNSSEERPLLVQINEVTSSSAGSDTSSTNYADDGSQMLKQAASAITEVSGPMPVHTRSSDATRTRSSEGAIKKEPARRQLQQQRIMSAASKREHHESDEENDGSKSTVVGRARAPPYKVTRTNRSHSMMRGTSTLSLPERNLRERNILPCGRTRSSASIAKVPPPGGVTVLAVQRAREYMRTRSGTRRVLSDK